VEALPTRDGPYFVWDDQVTGFGIRVMPSGTRTYQVQYRINGRSRRSSLGRHGVLTVDQARKHARALLARAALGHDPLDAARREERQPRVAMLCDRFLDRHVRDHCKPSTERHYRQIVTQFIKPNLGHIKVAAVERRDIADLHHRLADRRYQANRTLAVLSKMFNLAEMWGWRRDGSNPCRHIPKYRETGRSRYLSHAELAHLGQVLCEIESDGSETPHVVAAFRLLILTGCRLGEIQTLRWEHVTENTLELPDSKSGARRIPLPAPARGVLDALPRSAGNPFVIEGKWPATHVTDLERPWRRIRERAGLEDVRIHDLRHTYASNAVCAGMPIQMVGRLLGHTQLQTTMRYAHLADEPVKQAAEINSACLVESLGSAAP
jgi:integrase